MSAWGRGGDLGTVYLTYLCNFLSDLTWRGEEEKVRSDRLIQCFPTLRLEWHLQIQQLAAIKGISKTKCAAQIAHYALWNLAILDQLQPFFHFGIAVDWDKSASDNCFHAWMVDRKAKKIQPVIRAEQQDGKRLKFRIDQEDRHRQQVIAYGLGVTKADTIWSVLFPLTLLDGRSLWNLTNNRDVIVRGFHPLRQEWVAAKSWDNYRRMEVQA